MIYYNDDLQNMIDFINTVDFFIFAFDKSLSESEISDNDKQAIKYVLKSGSAEDFDRFDSDVPEGFIDCFEEACDLCDIFIDVDHLKDYIYIYDSVSKLSTKTTVNLICCGEFFDMSSEATIVCILGEYTTKELQDIIMIESNCYELGLDPKPFINSNGIKEYNLKSDIDTVESCRDIEEIVSNISNVKFIYTETNPDEYDRHPENFINTCKKFKGTEYIINEV